MDCLAFLLLFEKLHRVRAVAKIIFFKRLQWFHNLCNFVGKITSLICKSKERMQIGDVFLFWELCQSLGQFQINFVTVFSNYKTCKNNFFFFPFKVIFFSAQAFRNAAQTSKNDSSVFLYTSVSLQTRTTFKRCRITLSQFLSNLSELTLRPIGSLVKFSKRG